MREMKWTIWEYNHTPAALVEEIYLWIKTERQMQQEEYEKHKGRR
jgi:hypothetical protein